jgi:hypothetical protein
MHSATVLLPLLALAASVIAMPMPPHPLVRGVPNVHEVIRNPAPIDERISVNAGLKSFLEDLVDIQISTRATPKVEKKIKDPSTIV